MSTPIDLLTYILGYNQSVLCNTSKPHPSLKNKSSSIAFHFVREGTAKKEWRTAYMNTNSNPDDMITESLSGGEKQKKNNWLYTSLYRLIYLMTVD